MLRLLSSLARALSIFLHARDIKLSAVKWTIALVQMDSAVILSKPSEVHLDHLLTVLELLSRAGVSLKLKIFFFGAHIDYFIT